MVELGGFRICVMKDFAWTPDVLIRVSLDNTEKLTKFIITSQLTGIIRYAFGWNGLALAQMESF